MTSTLFPQRVRFSSGGATATRWGAQSESVLVVHDRVVRDLAWAAAVEVGAAGPECRPGALGTPVGVVVAAVGTSGPKLVAVESERASQRVVRVALVAPVVVVGSVRASPRVVRVVRVV